MQVIGHKKIISFLDRSRERNSFSGAYLFLGSKHLGKFTLALDFAEKITRPHSVMSECVSEMSLGSRDNEGVKINPDIIIIRPIEEEKKGVTKKKDIKVEQIRELQKALSMTPYFGKCKVAIVDDAERLTIAAQNSLLKILEEPDEKSVLILVAHNQTKILATIRSRSIIKNFNAVSEQEIAASLPSGAMSAAAVFWSLGRPGLAWEFYRVPAKLQLLEESKDNFMKLLRSGLADKFSLAEELGKDAENLEEQLQSWVILLRQNIKLGGSFLGISQEKSLAIIEKISSSLQLIRGTNSSARVVLENLLLIF